MSARARPRRWPWRPSSARCRWCCAARRARGAPRHSRALGQRCHRPAGSAVLAASDSRCCAPPAAAARGACRCRPAGGVEISYGLQPPPAPPTSRRNEPLRCPAAAGLLLLAAPPAATDLAAIAGQAVLLPLPRPPARLFIADPGHRHRQRRCAARCILTGRGAGETSWSATDARGRLIDRGKHAGAL